MNKKYIICDLDGTLFLDSNGTKRRERDFLTDHVVPEVRELLQRYYDHCILFVTGRKEKYRQDTTDKLWSIGFDVEGNTGIELFMRRNKDERPDAIVKEEIYQIKIKPHYEIAFVLEDLAEVCEMWKTQGLFVFRIMQNEKGRK